uniref:Uncharacterized protein n=1 Tax=Panthera tigris altaica TaxID=74533 RepID=A0A8C9MDI4_PANTA
MAAQGEPQVLFKLVLTLTWCLLSPSQRLSWTQFWQHSMRMI